jgi:hypothetical protein
MDRLRHVFVSRLRSSGLQALRHCPLFRREAILELFERVVLDTVFATLMHARVVVLYGCRQHTSMVRDPYP